MATRGQKATNRLVARVIPVILIGIIGYSAYGITKVVAIDYLIRPSPDLLVQPRPGSAVAILFFYYLLVIPLLVCYARLVQTIITNPGYVDRGAAWHQKHEEAARNRKHSRYFHRRRRPSSHFAEKASHSWPASTQDLESGDSNHSSPTTNIKHSTFNHPNRNRSPEIPFWQRDIFVCNPDGRPRFCPTCLTHKTDRTHHCSEVDRCVYKMDHFCPWVGGIVSETTFKYFIQFNVYAAMFCTMVLTTIAVFIAERRRIDGSFLDVQYFLLLGLSALFLLFSLGMAGGSIQLALINSSTVENLNRKTQVWFLAVLIPETAGKPLPSGPPPPPPPPASSSSPRQGAPTPRFPTITYPRPAEEYQYLVQQAHGSHDNNLHPLATTNPSTADTVPSSARTFAILSTKPGENPFDIGLWQNICQVMGYSLSEWVLPTKPSPCVDHSSRVSMYRMNEGLIDRLKEEAGLLERSGCEGGASRSERSRRDERGDPGGTGPQSEGEDRGSMKKKRRRGRVRRGEKE